MKVAVVGSRSFEDYDAMCSILGVCNIAEIISGGARGADRLAERYAAEHGIELTVCRADWDGKGKSAGFERNKMMVDMADAVVAFWDGESRGTRHTMQLCWKSSKPLMLVRTDVLAAGEAE